MSFSSLAKAAPFRKGKALFKKIPRGLKRLNSNQGHFENGPPIIVNSLLLMQVAAVLPAARNYGSFIAQYPSLTLKRRNQIQIDTMVGRIVPNEVLGAHLGHSKETTEAFRQKNALHLFIWRDPRDVVISEAYYLAKMNRWHAMHQIFARLKNPQDRIRLAIEGDGTERYPPAAVRFGEYSNWLSDPTCSALRYEELIDPDLRSRPLQRIAAAYEKAGGKVANREGLVQEMIEAIDPRKSHTFNKGGKDRWRNEMSESNLQLFMDQFSNDKFLEKCTD